MKSSGTTAPLTRLRGRPVVLLSDNELAQLKNRGIGDRGTVRSTTHRGHYIWLCHGVNQQTRRIDWICAAVVTSCPHDSDDHTVTFMLITRPQTNTSF